MHAASHAPSRQTSLRRSAALALVIVALLLGCRQHPSRSDGVSEDAPAAPVAPPPKAPEPPEPEPPAPEELPSLMKDHFGVATQARDAVVRGRLEHAEAPLTWLGQHSAARDMPTTWQPYVERMQQAARKAKAESTLGAAAQAIAATASECGACHTALHQGPAFETSVAGKPQAPAPGQTATPRAELRARMRSHAFAIERMWEGLVGPSDAGWQEGAASLAHLDGHPRVPAAQGARLQAVQALGEHAGKLAKGGERVALYGRLLAECGECHASAGLDPGMFQSPGRKPSAR